MSKSSYYVKIQPGITDPEQAVCAQIPATLEEAQYQRGKCQVMYVEDGIVRWDYNGRLGSETLHGDFEGQTPDDFIAIMLRRN